MDYEKIKNTIDECFCFKNTVDKGCILSNYNKLTSNTDNILDNLFSSKKHVIEKTMSSLDIYTHCLIPNVISNDLCDFIINESEKYANIYGWTTKRHKNYPTTDLPILNIPTLSLIINNFIRYNIFPIIEEKYNVSKYFLDCNDIFIVKYDANLQNKLDRHKDGCVFSFNILLNHESEFVGGGTIINENNVDILVKNSKGGLLLHSGRCFHSGNEITQGKRYILVGFISYLKTFPLEKNLIENKNINTNINTNINSWTIDSKLLEDMYDMLIKNSKLYLLDLNKPTFNLVEKIVYDITLFHLNRLGKTLNSDTKYYTEFWWKSELINHNSINIHSFHFDKDEFYFKKHNRVINPLLSTITYLNDSLYPTIITDHAFNSLNNEEDVSINKLFLSFPNKFKHICFDSRLKHGVSRVLNKDILPEIETRKALMINVWEEHKPLDIKLSSDTNLNNEFKEYNMNDIFDKDENLLKFEENKNIKNIILQNDIIKKISTYITQNKFNLVIPVLHKLIKIEDNNKLDLICIKTV